MASRSSRRRCNAGRSRTGPSCTMSRSCSGGKRLISRARSCNGRCSKRRSRAAIAARQAGSSSRGSIASRGSAVDALDSIRRLNEAGARLVSVEDNVDGSTPMGRFAIGILTLIAELELERIKENWSTAVREAVGRGIHISARPPTGFKRHESGRLVRNEPEASAIREVFVRRALGASWTELASFLEGEGVYPSTGNKHWSKLGVSGLVKDRVPRPGAQRLGREGGRARSDRDPRRVRCRAEHDDASQAAHQRDRIAGATRRSPPVRRLHAEGHWLDEQKDRSARADLLLRRPVRQWPMPGPSVCLGIDRRPLRRGSVPDRSISRG